MAILVYWNVSTRKNPPKKKQKQRPNGSTAPVTCPAQPVTPGPEFSHGRLKRWKTSGPPWNRSARKFTPGKPWELGTYLEVFLKNPWESKGTPPQIPPPPTHTQEIASLIKGLLIKPAIVP